VIANQSDYKQAQESCIQGKSRGPHWSLIGWSEDPTSRLLFMLPDILLLDQHFCRDAGCSRSSAEQWSDSNHRQTECRLAHSIQHSPHPRHRNMTSPIEDPHRRIENRDPPPDRDGDPEYSQENHISLLAGANRRKRFAHPDKARPRSTSPPREPGRSCPSPDPEPWRAGFRCRCPCR
jgi:hypothetical protein